MADIQQLLQQREELERQIKQMQNSARSDVLTQIRELMSQHNLTAADLTVADKKGAKKGGKVAPKYRDPDTGSTWSGRGLKPKWVTSALDSGKSLDDLAIKSWSAGCGA
ncbi:H-NS histone family protein [Azohydromonas australica]|uniref:H-NS histone family protein n=1 Tax=Azohydromonas australica TaxID=364039 RepID=UPI00048E875A|nr:H-NS histone family protein [Azohydromonas australica]